MAQKTINVIILKKTDESVLTDPVWERDEGVARYRQKAGGKDKEIGGRKSNNIRSWLRKKETRKKADIEKKREIIQHKMNKR